MKYIKLLVVSLLISSCAIEQDYFFDKSGEVKMDVGVDMSALFKSMPPGSDDKGLGNIKDSIDANTDLKDSMEQFGITKFEMDFDTSTYKLTSNMIFKMDRFSRNS